jgi:hypothetical protein
LRTLGNIDLDHFNGVAGTDVGNGNGFDSGCRRCCGLGGDFSRSGLRCRLWFFFRFDWFLGIRFFVGIGRRFRGGCRCFLDVEFEHRAALRNLVADF